MFRTTIVSGLIFSFSLVSLAPARAQDDVPSDNETTSTAESLERQCDLAGVDRFGKTALAAVDKAPDRHLKRCPEIAVYARASAKPADVPQPCADFAVLAADRKQVALYNWAYGTAVLFLEGNGKLDRAKRLRRALTLYNTQFETYEKGIAEFAALCLRVHSPSQPASAADLQTWSRSGRTMRSAVQTRRSAVWDGGGIKSALDSSFSSVVDALH